MKLVAIAERINCSTGEPFKTFHVIEHIPVEVSRDIGGWDGTGSGISAKDFANIIKELGAKNVQKVTIQLVQD